MKKSILTIISILLFSVNTVFAQNFSDIDNTNPYYQGINYLAEKNIINGYTDGSFKAFGEINRAELLKILISGTNLIVVKPDKNCFPDVPYNEWYAPYVCTAFEHGYVSGYPDGTFRPEKAVNKAEALKMLGEIYNWNLEEAKNTKIFSDTPENEWYAPYLKYAKMRNLLALSGTIYNPENNISRGSISESLYRFLVISESGSKIFSTSQSATMEMGFLANPTTVTQIINLAGITTDSTSGQKISATISLYDGNNKLVTSTVSDQNGSFHLDEVPAGNSYYLNFSKDGYFSFKTAIGRIANLNEIHSSLSRKFNQTTPEDLRIVLTWGDAKVDLDAHLIDNNLSEYYFMKRISNDLSIILDTDSADPWGTETITINELHSGEYSFFVHKYSGEESFFSANSRVEIYDKNGLIKAYYPSRTDEDIWKIFTISEKGEIIDINKIGSCESKILQKPSSVCL